MSVRMRCDVPRTWRIALSTWLPNALAALVAVEQRRENPRGQCGRREQQALAERAENHVAELARGGGTFRQLLVALDVASTESPQSPRRRPIRRTSRTPRQCSDFDQPSGRRGCAAASLRPTRHPLRRRRGRFARDQKSIRRAHDGRARRTERCVVGLIRPRVVHLVGEVLQVDLQIHALSRSRSRPSRHTASSRESRPCSQRCRTARRRTWRRRRS